LKTKSTKSKKRCTTLDSPKLSFTTFLFKKRHLKFKKASPSKNDSDLVLIDEEHITKGKQVKRSVKKSSTTPATGIIREPHIETTSKRKEKVNVTRGKGIKLLSEVALTKEAQMKEVRKKILRDFHKTHPCGSEDDSTESESKSWGNDEDDNNDDNDLQNEANDKENKSDDDKTPFDSEKGLDSKQDTDGSESDSESDQQEYEEEVKDDDDDNKSDGEGDIGMDDMTNQFSDDVQDKKADVEMTDAQQEKENLKITQEQVVEDAHVTITTVSKETEVPDASEVSNFAPPMIEKMIEESLNQVNLAKVSFQPQSTYEAAATLTEFELKKILIDKMNTTDKTRIKMKALPLDQTEGLKRERQAKTQKQQLVQKIKIQRLALPKAPSLNQNLLERLFNQKNQSSKLEILIRLKVKKGIWNRLTNLSRDDVADFAIALRMFTRSLVIQKRVEDLQHGVKSYQKHINVTKPDTTRSYLRKRHPYTPYKDPQGFIYVNDYKWNRLMRSDELYKFSDGTLTKILSSLKDITKNIDMEYLPKRR
nr:hypothetical protein [Tanacetum cinerariifolium]